MSAADLGIAEASARIAAGTLSPVELVDACLDRIAARDGAIHAFEALAGEAAREAARAAEAEIAAGRRKGPLHGIPIGLKDAIDVAGLPTTVCSRLRKDHVAGASAHVWERLAAAGAILLGKLACIEFCLGGPTPDGEFLYARNPWDADRFTGGSSSGSAAALAARLLPAALGTDTGGSVRTPAAWCGVTGLKPTFGRVSRSGVFPLSQSLDHVGPMARSARDCALLLQAMAGHDAADPASARLPVPDYAAALAEDDLRGLRIGHVRRWTETAFVTPAMRAATLAAAETLAGLGADIVEIDLPDIHDFAAANMTIMMAEAYALHEPWMATRWEEYSRQTRQRIGLGAFLSAADVTLAQRLRRRLVGAFRGAMAEVDAILYPAAPGAAPPREIVTSFMFLETPMITNVATLTGAPSIAVPAGADPETGLPLGVLVDGPHFGEATVLRIAHAFQEATDWHRRAPEFAAAETAAATPGRAGIRRPRAPARAPRG